MRWNWSRIRDVEDIAARWRAEHSAWLTAALEREKREKYAWPRIPLRRVDEGGFSGLTATPRGRVVCERWWRRALKAVLR